MSYRRLGRDVPPITITTNVGRCPVCSGRGRHNQDVSRPCTACGGTGHWHKGPSAALLSNATKQRYRVHWIQGYATDIQAHHSKVVEAFSEREARMDVTDSELRSCEGRITRVDIVGRCRGCGDGVEEEREVCTTCERDTKPANDNLRMTRVRWR